jgi:CBS domain-containing protein
MLLPAAISSAVSYVTFAAFAGTDPILPVAGQPPFTLRDLAGAALVGLVAGFLARAFAALVRLAKRATQLGHPLARAVVGGVVMGGVVLAGRLLSEHSLVVGPGYDALRWALDPKRSVVALIALGTLRVAGTVAILGGGGVGGLFVPLVVQGALAGRAVGALVGAENATLFPVVGMAAFLGAGYRVPLAAVVFVAEFTGRPGFVVPGLIAAVVAQLVVGRSSVTSYQVTSRVGHLESRMRLPLSAVVDTEARTVEPGTTVHELFWEYLVGGRLHAIAVVEGDSFVGMVGTDEVSTLERPAWRLVAVRDIMRTDVPTATPGWPLRDAVRVMETVSTDLLAVCDGGRFIGVISSADLVRLDEILGIQED